MCKSGASCGCGGGGGFPVALVLAVVAAAAVVVFVLANAGELLTAAGVFVAAIGALAARWHVVYVRRARPSPVRVSVRRARPRALPAPPKAIEAARVIPAQVIVTRPGERMPR